MTGRTLFRKEFKHGSRVLTKALWDGGEQPLLQYEEFMREGENERERWGERKSREKVERKREKVERVERKRKRRVEQKRE
jgi:hypothetical protein